MNNSGSFATAEFIACCALILGLGSKLQDKNMDRLGIISGAIGGVLAMGLDGVLLKQLAAKHDKDVPISNYLTSGELAVGVLLIVLGYLSGIAARHAVPVACSKVKSLFFSKCQSSTDLTVIDSQTIPNAQDTVECGANTLNNRLLTARVT